MKLWITLVGVALTATLAAGQNRQNPATLNPVRPMPAPPGTPAGNILFPGGVAGRALNNSFPMQLGGNISGGRPYTGGPGPGGGFRRQPRTVIVPYAVPVYGYGGYGPGYGGYGYDDPYAGQPNTTVIVPQQAPPSLIINQTFQNGEPGTTEVLPSGSGDSGLKVYNGSNSVQRPQAAPQTAAPAISAPAAVSARDEKPTIYLIALKDSTLRQAIGYWVEGQNLAYVTPNATITRISLDQVDKDLTIQLNAERNLTFDLKLP